MITNVHRSTLSGLADVLIPASEDMPSASQAGVSGAWLDAVLKILPDAEPSLTRVLDLAEGKKAEEEVSRLQAEDPFSFDVLTTVVAGAYFLNPEVCQALGYPGQRALSIVTETPPDYEQDGLLASVVARGPIYRPTPGR